MSSTNKSKEAEMDQFMEDFLNCRIDLDAPSNHNPTPTAGRRRSSNSHRRKRNSKTDQQGGSSIRRANTVDNPSNSSGKSMIRRTKSRDHDGSSNRRKSLPELQRQHQQANQAAAMDPHKIISMLEKYADLDDGDQADAYLHYGMQKKSSTASSSSGKKISKKKLPGKISSQSQSRAK